MTAKPPPSPDSTPERDRDPQPEAGASKPNLGIRVERADDSIHDHRKDIFFAAVQTTRMPMIVTDPRQPDNPIVFANQAFLNMTGYSAAEIIGSNCRFLQGPETDPATVTEIRDAIAERREIATEILNYRKDGYTFWNALFISPVFDEAGELVYYFASQLDVSRRREAEDALRQAQKMEALGRLTGGIAHDFNNLLQVMVGYLELIGNGIQKPEINREKLLRGVHNARSAADRATNLTQQLLSFARRQRLEGRVLNLNDLVDKLRHLADRTLGADVKIEMRIGKDLWNSRIDPIQVETALLNIMINARDAMVGRSQKIVTIETANVSVDHENLGRFPNLAPGRYASISVTDTGAGIPAHVVERVMDPFFTTKEEGKGTGMGLSMVYGFAKQSGGAAHIQSDEGIGTIVRIYFPAVDADAPKPEARSTRALDRPGDETILIVEDREDVAEIARLMLEDYGYLVLHAPNGNDAMKLIDSAIHIDLLFTDLVMPGEMNGIVLARAAKRRRARLKVLLTTGYAEAAIERSVVGGVEFDVLNKPYGRDELARKVRVILDGPTGVS